MSIVYNLMCLGMTYFVWVSLLDSKTSKCICWVIVRWNENAAKSLIFSILPDVVYASSFLLNNIKLNYLQKLHQSFSSLSFSLLYYFFLHFSLKLIWILLTVSLFSRTILDYNTIVVLYIKLYTVSTQPHH